ncbi:MAG: ATP-dependent helicase HrpB [Bacteroidota bacterium]
MNPLPIDVVLSELISAIEKNSNLVLSADPGAGKTTRVPIVLSEIPLLAGKKIITLEPRRLAAQRAAAYMAEQLGEKVGETVGYRIRGDSIVGKKTRVEVVTEGVLTRMLQSDPELPGVGLVIFDEFHERSIHTDLGLAFTLDVQQNLRPDLRILIMSATLDGVAISSMLAEASVIKSEGRMFPVETVYADQSYDGLIEKSVVPVIFRALRDHDGDILVFLPGQREIRRVESLLIEKEIPPNIRVHTMFGDASRDQQQSALARAQSGTRKIILSTSIAETSLTIDGVRVVIDSGLARTPRFDPRRGMSGLVTVPVSQATAEQRRGRAGRQQAGVCYRLWTEIQHHQLPKYPQPEILVADLSSFALEIARWGMPEGERLQFLDKPPVPHLRQARDLLDRLGAFDPGGKLSPHGKAMSELPVHPRFAHMLLRGKALELGSLACDVAALLDERDLLRGNNEGDIDLHSRLYVLKKSNSRNRNDVDRVRMQAKRLREILKIREQTSSDEEIGMLVALAYPERVGKRRDAESLKYQLSGGSGAILPKGNILSREEYLAISDVDGVGNEVKIFLAASLSGKEIETAFADQLLTNDEIFWDEHQEAVSARRVTRFGAIELSHVQITPPPNKIISVLIEGIRSLGLEILPWMKDADSIRERGTWLRKMKLVKEDFPDPSTEHLKDILEIWLAPYLHGITRRSQLTHLDMTKILKAMFSYEELTLIDKLAPTHLTVPTGSRIPVDYASGDQPILAVRLQEMFGQTETLTVGGGKIKVVLHLLSPSHRPLAVTQDLRSFWKNAYPDVRKDMRGRYPKHYWPDNPQEAEPTKRTRHK